MTSGGVEDDKNRSVVTESQHHQPPPPFQGVSYNPPPLPQQKPPATGFPQQAQPYVPGYAVTGGPATEPLPCFGLGVGWVLFILGFFFGVPWYVGLILLCCTRDRRERPGYIACAVVAVVATIFMIIQVIRVVLAAKALSEANT